MTLKDTLKCALLILTVNYEKKILWDYSSNVFVLLLFVVPFSLKEWADFTCSDQQPVIAVTQLILRWREAGKERTACCLADEGEKIGQEFLKNSSYH